MVGLRLADSNGARLAAFSSYDVGATVCGVRVKLRATADCEVPSPPRGEGHNSVRHSLGTGGPGFLLPLGEGQDEGDRQAGRLFCLPSP
jgi:hypothetical protein